MSKPLDTALVKRALGKQQAGRPLTQAEERALARFAREQNEAAFHTVAAAMPPKWLCEWTGKQHKQFKDLNRRHGLPCVGRTIDLPQLVAALFDLITQHAHRLPNKDSTGEGFREPESPALLRKREADADMAEMRRDEMAGRLMAIEDVRSVLATTAEEIRRGIERLRRKHGEAAAKVINDSLDLAERRFRAGLEQHD